MYRIISGIFKGRRISAPKQFDVRPTTDFAKEGLFNILQSNYDFEESSVLDLYAGIGSVTMEFISRGVPKVVDVEQNIKHGQFIEKTAMDFGVSDRLEMIYGKVESVLPRLDQSFDIVFADPPYNLEFVEYENLVQDIYDLGLMAGDGILIVEHVSKLSLVDIDHFVENRKYGNVGFSFFK